MTNITTSDSGMIRYVVAITASLTELMPGVSKIVSPARDGEGQESLTQSGEFVGTPLYMSPEQAKARKTSIDHRTDIYSLGATMYETLTFRPPFKGRNQQETISQIITKDPQPLRKMNHRIPRDLETIVLKAIRSMLKEIGLDMEHIVRTDVHLANLDDFDAMDGAYRDFFSDGCYPARTTTESAHLFICI